MSNPTPTTVPLGQCFDIRTDVAPRRGDLLLLVDGVSGKLQAQVACEDMDSPRIPRVHAFVLLEKGLLLPEIMAAMIRVFTADHLLPAALKRDVKLASPSAALLSTLNRFLVQVPPMEQQQQMLDILRVSSGWLDGHVQRVTSLNEKLSRLSRAIERKVLSGDYGRTEALALVQQAMAPQLPAAFFSKTNLPVLSAHEAAHQPDGRFVDARQHADLVNSLFEEIERLKQAADAISRNPSEATPHIPGANSCFIPKP